MAGSERTDPADTTAAETESASTSQSASASEPTAAETESAAGTTAPDAGFAGVGAGREDTEGSPWSPAATLDAAGIRCECLMNARYHAAREAFLDTIHRWFMFAVIALGMAAVIDVFPKEIYGVNFAIPTKEIFTALAAIIAALDLTFDLSNRARLHALMKRRYFELAGNVIAGKETLLDAQACLDKYSADEEPAYYALLIASWNAAQEMVYGDDAYAYRIPRWHLRLKNLWRFGGRIYPLQPKHHRA